MKFILLSIVVLFTTNNLFSQCTPNAGANDSVCGLTYSLQGNLTQNGNITWASSESSIFADNTSLSTDVTIPDFTGYQKTVQFILTVITYDLSCTSSDTVDITFFKSPNASAGFDAIGCGQMGSLHADTTFQGYWTTNDNAVIYPDTTLPNTSVWIPSFSTQVSDPITFTWHSINGSCSSTDDVILTFYRSPHAEAGASQIVNCSPTTQLMADTIGSSATNFYWSCNIPGVVISDPNNPITNVDVSNCFGYINSSSLVACFHFNVYANNCWSTDSVIITFNSNALFGNIITSPALSGITIEAYKTNNHGQGFDESTYIYNSNSLFSLPLNSNTNYLVLVKNNNSNVLNTYFQNANFWENATPINISGCDTINLNLNQVSPLSGGIGSISGQINYDSPHVPVRDVDVYLLNNTNSPLIKTISDINGHYSFSNLPSGTYSMRCDIPGLPQITTHIITIDANNTSYTNVNFIVDTISISKNYGFGISVDSTGWILSSLNTSFDNISLFPNPVIENLNIQSLPEGTKNIILINTLGQTVISSECTESNLNLDLSQLPNGVYELKVENENFKYSKKVVIQH